MLGLVGSSSSGVGERVNIVSSSVGPYRLLLSESSSKR